MEEQGNPSVQSNLPETSSAPLALDPFEEAIFEIRAVESEVVIEKQARIVEEIIINKSAIRQTETVQETARQTVVDVQEVPGSMQETSYQDVTRLRAGSDQA